MATDDTPVESGRGGPFDIFAGLLLFATIVWGCTLGDPAASVSGSEVSEAPAPVVEDAVSDALDATTEDAENATGDSPIEEQEPIKDPFTVDLTIENFEDPQEGWLKIGGQGVRGKTSTAAGRYVGNNEFYLETSNVDLFSINLATLPELPGRRLTVHLDGQNLVIFPKSSALTFTRDKTGQWVLLKR